MFWIRVRRAGRHRCYWVIYTHLPPRTHNILLHIAPHHHVVQTLPAVDDARYVVDHCALHLADLVPHLNNLIEVGTGGGRRSSGGTSAQLP